MKRLKYLSAILLCIVIVISFTGCGCNEPESTYWETKVAAFREQNRVFEHGQIVFIGDSNTDYYDLNHHFNLPLKTYNRGIGGDNTDGVLNRMEVSLYEIEPSKIIINIGTNDFAGGKSVSYVYENYSIILAEIKENLPLAQVFVQSIYPTNSDCPSHFPHLGKVIEINPQLQTLAESFGYIYINTFSVIKDENNHLKREYTNDGLHPNVAGYSAITQKILEYL